MIISASRRTDIPEFYSDWLINRINAGFCLVKNSFNPMQIKRVSLSPEDVDGFVLWTKNAAPLLPKIAALEPYKYYFQYSITPYHSDVESALASKQDIIIPTFMKLAEHIGAERVIWRYDPIIVNERYDFNYHIGAFSRLCKLLEGSTKKCVISFVVEYKSIAKNMKIIGNKALELQEKLQLANELQHIAHTHGISLHSCCDELGVQPISCVDAGLFGVIAPRDKNQRTGCNCAVSVDIGVYNTCMNGCRYCYANHSAAAVIKNYTEHDSAAECLL